MTVERWDPGAAAGSLDDDSLKRLLEAAQHLDEPRFGLDPDTAGRLAPMARHRRAGETGVDWRAAAEPLGDDQILALIRLFTLAEPRLPGWEAGDRSPVIPLVAALKDRGRYPAEVTAWIRSVSDNRFLPYGNLMDRL